MVASAGLDRILHQALPRSYSSLDAGYSIDALSRRTPLSIFRRPNLSFRSALTIIRVALLPSPQNPCYQLTVHEPPAQSAETQLPFSAPSLQVLSGSRAQKGSRTQRKVIRR
ncbi:hypothetical protein XPA_008734 [Xanthoria parietina]